MIYFFSHYWNGNATVKLAFYYLQVTKNFLLLINIFQMKYLQNDLITPLERLAESDVLYVKVHSAKNVCFWNVKGYIIPKLWLQSYAWYGEIRKAHKQKWLFAVMAIYNSKNISVALFYHAIPWLFFGDLAVTTIFVKTTYVPLLQPQQNSKLVHQCQTLFGTDAQN